VTKLADQSNVIVISAFQTQGTSDNETLFSTT